VTKSDSIATTVGVHEAKTHLSRLLRLVESGAEVHIMRGGEPIARIVPMESPVREIGFADGAFVVPEDFDDTDPELIDSFYAG
jgi:prevent-host-death family protein